MSEQAAQEALCTVWKETRPVADVIELALPQGAEVLKVGDQEGAGGALTFWFLVRDLGGVHETPMGHPPSVPVADRPKELRRFVVVGTGHEVPEERLASAAFLDTVVTAGGMLVWHVFAESAPPESTERRVGG